MGTRINGAFDHSDEVIKYIFENGQEHTAKAMQSIEYSNNASQGSLGGNQPNPVTIVAGKAEPTWSGEMPRHEVDEMITKMGNGFEMQPFTIIIAYRKRNLQQVVDTVLTAYLGAGVSSAVGESAMVKLGSNCTECLLNGFSPFDRNPAQT